MRARRLIRVGIGDSDITALLLTIRAKTDLVTFLGPPARMSPGVDVSMAAPRSPVGNGRHSRSMPWQHLCSA